jgi:hypothetical protein
MKSYRKKPVVIEAVQLTHENFAEVKAWCGGTYWSEPPMRAITGIAIATLEGEMHASYGDWIIRGVKGEFYPCKPDIFEATYTEVGVTARKAPETDAIERAIPEDAKLCDHWHEMDQHARTLEEERDQARDRLKDIAALGTVYRKPDDWDYPGQGGGPELKDCDEINLTERAAL